MEVQWRKSTYLYFGNDLPLRQSEEFIFFIY